MKIELGRHTHFIARQIEDPSQYYFPLCNENKFNSVTTPQLQGDIKLDQNHFLSPPVSIEDLKHSNWGRNVWLKFKDGELWSATGNSARQHIERSKNPDPMATEVEGGLLYQIVRNTHHDKQLEVSVKQFVPLDEPHREALEITLINRSQHDLELALTYVQPLYARSADNLRDHRHVTSLLNVIRSVPLGIEVEPTLSFDERGHIKNSSIYAVYGQSEQGEQPDRLYSDLNAFCGRGTLDWPQALIENHAGQTGVIKGVEALGGLGFPTTTLGAGQQRKYRIISVIRQSDLACDPSHLLTQARFAGDFEALTAHWADLLATLSFDSGQTEWDKWLSWVNLQPELRRIMGNSFLPHHDYGRGGRGWRDLWQDRLVQILRDPEAAAEHLYQHFAGIRLDGSNATIIGSNSGEFIADRNAIPRVWMDHGAWPWLTTRLYLDQTGDLEFLLRDQSYFRDQHLDRCTRIDPHWSGLDRPQYHDIHGEVYQGSILEHLLVQHLSAFYNVGDHHHIRLEGADWNDGLDMAPEKGESVTFTALYAGNFMDIAHFIQSLSRKLKIETVSLSREIVQLLEWDLSLDDPQAKRAHLAAYFKSIDHGLSGEKSRVKIKALSQDLEKRGLQMFDRIHKQEWLTHDNGTQWLNGYYDNDGKPLASSASGEERMTLAAQTFPMLAGALSATEARQVIRAVKSFLWDDQLHGPRLNTDFKEVRLNMGRMFGFAYGHKENGALFSHMAVMWAYALYDQGFVEEGYRVLRGLFEAASDYKTSQIFPGLPEYFDGSGRGLYHYLTGSASWYLLTMLTQVYGVRGYRGDLVLDPKLMPEQFDAEKNASVVTRFGAGTLKVIYHNPDLQSPGDYQIQRITLAGKTVSFEQESDSAIIKRKLLKHNNEAGEVTLECLLG